jgi:broad specificity phosphatase PhoE
MHIHTLPVLRSFKQLLLITLSVFFLGAGTAEAGLKIYYIRHAEYGRNVEANWEKHSDIPKEAWPAYVGDLETFTPTGKSQVGSVASKLKPYHFDFIACSPVWRARKTILPYMQETGATGEMWPELCEYWQSDLILSPDLPTPTTKILGAGHPLKIAPEETAYFSLREDGQYEMKLPPWPQDGKADNIEETAASRVVIQHVIDMIHERFGGSDKSILLAGHGYSGIGLLKMLMQDDMSEYPPITNTGIWMVEEQDDGSFKLMIYNDVPRCAE